jgi:hypothetical protein
VTVSAAASPIRIAGIFDLRIMIPISIKAELGRHYQSS